MHTDPRHRMPVGIPLAALGAVLLLLLPVLPAQAEEFDADERLAPGDPDEEGKVLGLPAQPESLEGDTLRRGPRSPSPPREASPPSGPSGSRRSSGPTGFPNLHS